MRRTPDEILNTIADKRDIILGFGVRRLGIFGSYARGE
jgi:predicted nucleotidyltransferase